MKQLIFVSLIMFLLVLSGYAAFTMPTPVYAVDNSTSSTSTSDTSNYASQLTGAINLIIELVIALIPALIVLKIIDRIFGGLFRGRGSFFFTKLKTYMVKASPYLSLAPLYLILDTSSSVSIDLSFLYPLINIILLFAILGAIMKMMDRMAKDMGR